MFRTRENDVKQRTGSRLLLLLAAIALVLASCASSDDDGGGDGGGGGGGGGDSAATCKGKAGEEDTAEALGKSGDADGAGEKIGMVFDVGGKGDKSFNDSAFAGLTAAGENMGVEVKELEPSEDGSNREALLRQLAEEDYGLIIGVGFAFAEVMPGVATDFPDTEFAIVDSVVEDAPNVTSIVFAEEEGSYLVGAAAAQASKSGTIGFVGGVDTELIKKFEAGYIAGAEQVNPDIEVEVKYISTGDDFSGFADPAAGETTAAGLYEAGADVVYHASGGSGSGVFKAAAAAKRLSIGVDSNQYLAATEPQQKCMLTSMLKRVDVSVYETIKNYVGGQKGGEVSAFSLENDGIGYATQGGQLVDEKELEDFKKQIIDGEIEVPTEP
ncbi:MAG: BMP family ABC transporter substrate-binding protein [Acidimicrobiia bacterium]|nr:BMP family ABC transporter substrate-binding protein [Acidimicrobiia bacterium]